MSSNIHRGLCSPCLLSFLLSRKQESYCHAVLERYQKMKTWQANFLNFFCWKCCTRGQTFFTNSFTTLHHLWLCKNKLYMTPGGVTSGLSPLFRKISCLNSSSVCGLNLSNNRALCNQLRVVSMFSIWQDSFSLLHLLTGCRYRARIEKSFGFNC